MAGVIAQSYSDTSCAGWISRYSAITGEHLSRGGLLEDGGGKGMLLKVLPGAEVAEPYRRGGLVVERFDGASHLCRTRTHHRMIERRS